MPHTEQQPSLYTEAGYKIADAVEDPDLAERIIEGYRQQIDKEDFRKSPQIGRIESRTRAASERLLDKMASELTSPSPSLEFMRVFNEYEGTAVEVEKLRPRVSETALRNRKYPDETIDDLRDAAYIKNRVARTAGEVKTANLGDPTDAWKIELKSQAGDSRSDVTRDVVIARVFRDHPVLYELGANLEHRIKETNPQADL